VAISDPSETLSIGVAAKYGIKAFTRTERLLEEDVDAVLIATPDRFHQPLGTLALKAGKHVLMEKPLAATVDEAQELADLAAAAGLRLQTGAMKRHDPGLAFAKAHIDKLGPILSFISYRRVMSSLRAATEATLFPAVVVDQEVRKVEDTFKAQRERYLLATHGAHLFDGLTYFGGPATWVSARVGNVGDDYTWHGEAGLANSNGLVSFEISAAVHGNWAEGTDVYGAYGQIKTRSHFPFFKRASDVEVHIEGDGVSVVPHFGDTDPYKLQAEHFAEAILTGQPVPAALRRRHTASGGVGRPGKRAGATRSGDRTPGRGRSVGCASSERRRVRAVLPEVCGTDPRRRGRGRRHGRRTALEKLFTADRRRRHRAGVRQDATADAARPRDQHA
jgi:predicted dehydrogenase